jgi:hypothetical protein
VLINSLLSSVAMFMLCFFEVPRGVLKKLSSINHGSFCNTINRKGNIDLRNGPSFVSPKEREE